MHCLIQRTLASKPYIRQIKALPHGAACVLSATAHPGDQGRLPRQSQPRLQVNEEPAPFQAEPAVPAAPQQEPAQQPVEKAESADPAAIEQATQMDEEETPAAANALPEEAPSHSVQAEVATEPPLHPQVQEQSEEPMQPSPAELSAEPHPAAAEAEDDAPVSTRHEYEPASMVCLPLS